MPKVVPMVGLQPAQVWSMDLISLLTDEKATVDDPYAYVTRVSVESPEEQLRLRTRILQLPGVEVAEAIALIEFLDRHSWDASFLVDGW